MRGRGELGRVAQQRDTAMRVRGAARRSVRRSVPRNYGAARRRQHCDVATDPAHVARLMPVLVLTRTPRRQRLTSGGERSRWRALGRLRIGLDVLQLPVLRAHPVCHQREVQRRQRWTGPQQRTQ